MVLIFRFSVLNLKFENRTVFTLRNDVRSRHSVAASAISTAKLTLCFIHEASIVYANGAGNNSM